MSTLTTSLPQIAENCQAIAFEIAGYSLGLPASAIAKINLFPEFLEPDIQTGELIYLGNQVATFLDPQQSLSRLKANKIKTSELLPATRKFLMIVYLDKTLCAIPVDKPPTMVTLPLAEVQPLPQSYPKGLRSLFQNFIALALPEGVRTIFLMNLSHLLSAIANSEDAVTVES
jgi:chemotaxis signal transduction protein